MELLALTLKKVSYFFKRKLFSYFRKLDPALFSPSSKNKKIRPEKFSNTLGKMELSNSLFLHSLTF